MLSRRIICIYMLAAVVLALIPVGAAAMVPASGAGDALVREAWLHRLNTSLVGVMVYGDTVFAWTNTSLTLYSAGDGAAQMIYMNVSAPASPLYVAGNTYIYLSNTGNGLVLYMLGRNGSVERIQLGQAVAMGSMYIAAAYIDIPAFLVSQGFSMTVLRVYRNGTVEQLNESNILYLSRPVLGDSDGDGLPDYSDGEIRILYSVAGGEVEVAIYYTGSMGTLTRSYRGQLFPYLATIMYSPTRSRPYLVVRGYELRGTGGFEGNNTLLIYDVRNNALVERYTEEMTLSMGSSSAEEILYGIAVVDDNMLRAGRNTDNETVIYVKSIGAGEWRSILVLGNASAQVIGLPDIDGDGGLDALVATNTSEAYIVFHNTSTAGPYRLNITRPRVAGAAVVNDTLYIIYYNDTCIAASRITAGKTIDGGEGGGVTVDNTPPQITSFNADVYEDIVLFTWSVVDNGSGIASILLEVDGKTINVTGKNLYRLIGVSPGTHTARLVVVDVAGNRAEKEITFTAKEQGTSGGAGGGEEAPWLLIAVAAAAVAAAAAFIIVRQRRAPSGAI